MRRISRLLPWLVLAVAILPATLWGQVAGPAADPAVGDEGVADLQPAEPLDVIDVAELEAFVDGFMGAYLAEAGVAGAVVSVVQGGSTIFAKGYGSADVERRRKVDAAETLFRIGSVSKLFVWTAVMQLVEAGDLDLDADVNTYLGDVQVPDTFEEPVTLAQLMTHTAGFEDRALGLFARSPEALAPLGEILAEEMPARVRAPGEVSSYSNHGTGLAMYVVEKVSGVAWETYLARNVLGPLGMTRTTFAQPPPPALADAVSRGYRLRGEELQEEGFEYIPLAPVGAASATATDMARFMIAHLQLGGFEGARILEEETARQMQSELFRHSENVNPMAHGFIDSSRNGQRIIGHGGDTLWFHTQLELLPGHDVGIFVSMNTAGASPGRLTEAFVDRYFPQEDPTELTVPPDWQTRIGRYVGSFRSNRFSHTDLTKLAALMGTLEVTDSGDGALLFSMTGTTRWVEVEPLVFREEGTHRKAVFRQSEDGRVTHLFLGDVPVVAFERVPPRESVRLHLLLLLSSMTLILGTVVFQPVGVFLRWRYRAPLERDRRIPTTARVVLWLAALLFTVFAVGMATELDDPMQVVFGLSAGLRTVLVLPIVAAVLALIALAYAIWLWREQQGRLLGRVFYTAVVIAFFVFLWQLAIWRLLGAS